MGTPEGDGCRRGQLGFCRLCCCGDDEGAESRVHACLLCHLGISRYEEGGGGDAARQRFVDPIPPKQGLQCRFPEPSPLLLPAGFDRWSGVSLWLEPGHWRTLHLRRTLLALSRPLPVSRAVALWFRGLGVVPWWSITQCHEILETMILRSQLVVHLSSPAAAMSLKMLE